MRYPHTCNAGVARDQGTRACRKQRLSAAQPRHGRRSAFTLIETLIVVVILGILASIVIPRLTNANEDTDQNSLLRHLQILRNQIEFFRNREGGDPDLVGLQWDEMVLAGNDYLSAPPKNPLNGLSNVVNDAANGPAGWVWRDKGNGTWDIYATDDTEVAEYIE